jgi:pyruvate kinase
MATINNMSTIMCRDHRILSSSSKLSDVFMLESRLRKRCFFRNPNFTVRSMKVREQNQTANLVSSNGPLTAPVSSSHLLLICVYTHTHTHTHNTHTMFGF